MGAQECRAVGSRVLVVEDDPAIALVLRRLLERSGFVVNRAEDGLTAVDRFDRDPPDLVLLDVTLPDIDGWTVLRHIRGESASAVPVVVVTSHVQSRDRSLAEGADAFLAKPFDNSELVAQVDALLAN
jgi:DNA-binding response OmpR family regulator